MLRRRSTLAAIPAALLTAGALRAQSTVPPATATNVVDTLARLGGFDEFLRLAQRAGRIDLLRGTGPFILRAPTDAALGRIPRQAIEALAPSTEGPNQPDADLVRLMSFVDGHIVEARGSLTGTPQRFTARNRNVIELTEGADRTVQVCLIEGPGFSAGGLTLDGRERVVERGEVIASNGVVWPVSLPLLA